MSNNTVWRNTVRNNNPESYTVSRWKAKFQGFEVVLQKIRSISDWRLTVKQLGIYDQGIAAKTTTEAKKAAIEVVVKLLEKEIEKFTTMLNSVNESGKPTSKDTKKECLRRSSCHHDIDETNRCKIYTCIDDCPQRNRKKK